MGEDGEVEVAKIVKMRLSVGDMFSSPGLLAILERFRVHREWYNKSYSGYYAGVHLQGLAVAEESKSPWGLGYGVLFQNYATKDHLDWFWDGDDLREKREAFLFMAKMNPSQIDVLLQEGEANHVRFVRYAEPFASMRIQDFSDKELREHFAGLKDELISVSQWSYSGDAFLSDSGDDWLEIIIKQYLGKRATAAAIATLTAPTFPSFVNEAEGLFLRIVESLSRADAAGAEALAVEYVQRYFWIRTNYLVYAQVTEEQILEEARTWLLEHSVQALSKKLKEEASRIHKNREKKQALFEKLEAPPELRSVLRLSEVFTHLQDRRKERVLRMNCLFYPFIQEVERRFQIESPLGFYLTADELFSLFDGIVLNWQMIRERYQKGFVTIFSSEGVKLFRADDYKAEGWDRNFFQDVQMVKDVKGTTAYRGIVKGVVRVLKTVADIAQFQVGEILVANQTTPEYMPAMKKAAAMVTDQGGITCHAAIVSRELKIPTVIGTKVATQVLKDGDVVEVDAEKGIVSLLLSS